MYLDEVFNNFLGTLQHAPDIRINNPGLEQGKFVNNRARYYAGKNVITTTMGPDGSCKFATLTMQKPDLDLIERSSGPEYGTVMEGFTGGSIIEGLTAAQTTQQQQYVSLLTSFTDKRDDYTRALKSYNTLIQTSQYLDKYVKLKISATPVAYDTYYINKYGFRYKIPALVPNSIVPALPVLPEIITEIDAADFAKFPLRDVPLRDVVVAAGQQLNLAGTIVKYTKDGVNVYAWIDIEGIAHIFDSRVLSDSVNNCDASCWEKNSSTIFTFASEASFKTAMGPTTMIGDPITINTNIACIELPKTVIDLKTQLDAKDAELKAAASNLGMIASDDNLYNEATDVVDAATASDYLNIKSNMSTYEGKVDDSGLNVKSKLGYYVLWVSLMIFVVVVTFRNIANSDSTESGSFMISAALLIILLIYLFNYLSEFRLGPQQLLSKAAGDLPEKVSGMMKFTFT